MKPIFFLLLIIAVQKECTRTEAIAFLDATSQAWMGGPAATHGTYYKIYFRLRDTTGYLFDSLWVNGKRLPVSFIRSTSPNDTLLLMANDHTGIRNPVTGQEVSNAVQAPFPVETQASGLAGYFFKGERHYMQVPQWRQLKPVYYQ